MKKSMKALAIAATIAVAGAAPTMAKEFIYGSWFGVNHSVNQKGLAPYFALLEEKTGGDVSWKLVAGAQLSSGPGTPEAVETGLMDGGIAIAPYQPSMLSATNFLFSHSLPGEDSLAATGAMNEVVMLGCPECTQEYHNLNAVGFGGYSTTPYVFMCRDVITSVEDMKGLKIRASGGGVNIAEIAGATPVSMSPAEATSALERGTLDCVLGAVSWLRSYGYIDVVESVVNSPMGMGGPPILMFINRDAWDSMTPEMRAAHIELAPDLVAGASFDGQVVVDEQIAQTARDAGIVFTENNDGFAQLMVERDKQQREINMRNATNAGVEHGAEALEFYLAAYDKWQRLLNEQGHDRDTYRRLLWEEVYSKVDPENL